MCFVAFRESAVRLKTKAVTTMIANNNQHIFILLYC